VDAARQRRRAAQAVSHAQRARRAGLANASLGAGILGHGRLAPRDREIVIARTCAQAGAEYEWACTCSPSPSRWAERRADRGDRRRRRDNAAWSSGESLLIELCDELHDTATVSDELWIKLAAIYAEDQLLELLVTAGWYRLLSS